jgi:hypothetical protein
MRVRLCTIGSVLAACAAVGAGCGWVTQPAPSPPGAHQSSLVDVSCPQPQTCFAVGSYVDPQPIHQPTRTLVERGSGGTWQIESSPNTPNAPVNELNGVSCPSVTQCVAVGRSGGGITEPGGSSNPVLALAEHWNGSEWTIRPTPSPTGAHGSRLNSVSCPEPNACFAVGSYTRSDGTGATLAEFWDGTRWTILPTPNPTGATSVLNGVSCATRLDCIAVGTHGGSAISEHWNGSSWALVPTPVPAGATSSSLHAVSCTTASSCAAVGDYFTGAPGLVALAEGWNGSSWEIQRTPTDLSSSLSSVSCPAEGVCSAVGSRYGSAGSPLVNTLAERRNRGDWNVQPTPNPMDLNTLSGVSCATQNACTAVGSAFDLDTGENTPLIEAFTAGT